MAPWRRHRKEPEKRLDWRDPDMPVLRAMTTGMEALSPKSESEYSQDVMQRSIEPEWRKDPAYNFATDLAKKRGRKPRRQL